MIAKNKMEWQRHRIILSRCKDLMQNRRAEDQTETNGEGNNVYRFVISNIRMHPNGYYFLDEVPSIREGIYCISIFHSLNHC